MTVTTWEDVSAAKCAAREALIPAEWRTTVPKDVKNVTSIPANCGVLTAEEVAITEMTAPKLIELMTAGTLTSEAVTLAFCKRAAIAHQLTNCLTEIFFDAALDRARAIDAEFKAKGTPAGPLHGLPISLKDNIDVTGYDSTVGFVSYANHPATEEADLVRTMINAGAVIFCKTNVPTGMVSTSVTQSLTLSSWARLTTMSGDTLRTHTTWIWARVVHQAEKQLCSLYAALLSALVPTLVARFVCPRVSAESTASSLPDTDSAPWDSKLDCQGRRRSSQWLDQCLPTWRVSSCGQK